MNVKIAPSILTADFSRLGEQVREVISAGAAYIHVDVMDGHFVPNLTIGPLIVDALRPITQPAGVLLDVHLMVEHPERLLADFAKAGADILTVHVETCPDILRTVQQIKQLGIRAGVTLNPATPLVMLDEILAFVDLVLILSVCPGFGGQAFIPASTSRIKRLRKMLDERQLSHVELEVDGGIKVSNATAVVEAGATVLVVGTGIFNQQGTITQNMAALKAAIGL